MAKLYLNGHVLWRIVANRTLVRLGKYRGHGFCYELSTLIMLAWKDHVDIQLVYGDAEFDDGMKGDHCWVEIMLNGEWWVFDFAWYAPIPFKLDWYYHDAKCKPIRTFTHDEFWKIPYAKQFYRCLLDPKTSYLLGEMSIFRPYDAYAAERELFIYKRPDRLDNIPLDELGKNFSVLAVFLLSKPGRPITQLIFNQFVASDKRLYPKRRAFLEAKREVSAIKNFNPS